MTVTSGGKQIGRLPFILARELGTRICAAPRLAHFLGPAIDEGEGGTVTRTLRRARIARELIEALPGTDAFYQRCHRGITETIAFQEIGFDTGVLFTHEIAPAPEDVLWRAMRDKTRNVIRRAQERLTVGELHAAAEFFAFYKANLDRRGARNHYDPATAIAVCEAALLQRRGRILTARDETGAPVAAIFYVWDATAAYYMLSSRCRDADNGAVALLLWEAVRDAAGRGLVFDMDGSGTVGSALFYAGFGGVIRPRYIVSRSSIRHGLTRRLVGGLGRRSRLY